MPSLYAVCVLVLIFATSPSYVSAMRIRFFALLTLLFSLFIVSCQKEYDPFDPSQQPATGDSTSNGSDTSSAGTYFPLTTGTWWKYKDSLTSVETTTTLASPTRMINGILYKAFVTVSDIQNDTEWVAAPRPNYYLSAQGVSPSGSVYDLTFNYLNDTASVGYSWRYNAGSGNDFTAYVTTTIVAKNLTITVAGKTYTNVIQTRLDLAYDIFGTVSDYGNYNYFTAKGVGIVKIRSELSLAGVPVYKTSSDLLDYSIK